MNQTLIDILRNTRGKVFRVTFTKRTTGETRHLVGRLGVHRNLKGTGLSYNPSDKNLITVYDFQKRDYRSIPMEGIQEIRFRGETYR